jgi:hypothetical protein
MRIPPNVSPTTFTLSAFIIGYLMTIDLTILEQVAVGNWLGLISQVLGANSAQQLLLQGRAQQENAVEDIESVQSATGQSTSNMNSGSRNNNNNANSNRNKNVYYNYYYTEKEELELLKKALAKIQKQLDEIMKE